MFILLGLHLVFHSYFLSVCWSFVLKWVLTLSESGIKYKRHIKDAYLWGSIESFAIGQNGSIDAYLKAFSK